MTVGTYRLPGSLVVPVLREALDVGYRSVGTPLAAHHRHGYSLQSTYLLLPDRMKAILGLC